MMKYFKDKKTNEVYAYETEAKRQEWGAPDLVKMTPAEVDTHLAPKPPTAGDIRAERDRLIESVRWRIERHSDELALGSEPTEPLETMLQYTQDLSDIPQQTGFPTDIVWPEVPNAQH